MSSKSLCSNFRFVCFFNLLTLLACFQRSTALLPELLEIVDSFKQLIMERKAKEFFGAKTSTSLRHLELEVKERLSSSFLVSFVISTFCNCFFQDFYTTVIEYIDKWFRVELLPTNISWIVLKTKNIDYTEAVELAKQVAPGIAEKDELFNEVVEVNRMLRQIPEEVFDVDPAEIKWQKIFQVSEIVDFEICGCLYSFFRAMMRFHIYIGSSVPSYPSSWPMLS